MREGFDLPALAGAVAAHGSVTRVVIAAMQGSTPRETGAAMLVWSTGQSGTIGGGALEWEAAAAARRLPEAAWARQVLKLPLGPALGQCCGGHVTLLLEHYGVEEIAVLQRGLAAPFVRPVVSGQPPGAAALAERRARRAARSGARAGAELADGNFIEPLAEVPQPVWLYGAGHVGRAIVRVSEDLPLAITWIDTHPERFPDSLPAHAERLVATDPSRAVAHAPEDAIHLVLTYSHALDLAVCAEVLRRPHRHLGLIGSASKKARFLSRLRDAGLPEAALLRLRCPIGDRTLGKRPAAVALGVVAEVLRIAEARDTVSLAPAEGEA